MNRECGKHETNAARKKRNSQSTRLSDVPHELPYDNEEDLQEAVDNFRAYVAILRKWDRQEKTRTATSKMPTTDYEQVAEAEEDGVGCYWEVS